MDPIGYLRALLASGIFVLVAPGCMIPIYHQPQGFSSTYYRHLQQSAPVMAAGDAVPPSIGHAENEDRLSEPEKLVEDKNAEPLPEKSGSWWSWIRRPLTFGSGAEPDTDGELSGAEGSPAERAIRR